MHSFRCHHWGIAAQLSYMPEQINPLGSSSCTCFLSPCKTSDGVSTPEESRHVPLSLWDIRRSTTIQVILQHWVTSSCILTLPHQEFVLRHKYRSWELLLSVGWVPFGAESDSFRKLSSSRISTSQFLKDRAIRTSSSTCMSLWGHPGPSASQLWGWGEAAAPRGECDTSTLWHYHRNLWHVTRF